MTELALGVTGTDTGVGKTVVACALAAALVARGRDVGVLKPVETGVTRGAIGTDASALRRAAGDRDAIDRVCPVTLAEPLAPWIAAERAGTRIDHGVLDDAYASLRAERDALVVEGAGGLLVPFDETTTFVDLARRWRLDVVLVAANRLGVINHTMLTLREAARHRLTVRAVVLNTVNDGEPDLAQRTNAGALGALAAPVPLVVLPFLRHGAAASIADLAAHGQPLAAIADAARR